MLLVIVCGIVFGCWLLVVVVGIVGIVVVGIVGCLLIDSADWFAVDC